MSKQWLRYVYNLAWVLLSAIGIASVIGLYGWLNQWQHVDQYAQGLALVGTLFMISGLLAMVSDTVSRLGNPVVNQAELRLIDLEAGSLTDAARQAVKNRKDQVAFGLVLCCIGVLLHSLRYLLLLPS